MFLVLGFFGSLGVVDLGLSGLSGLGNVDVFGSLGDVFLMGVNFGELFLGDFGGVFLVLFGEVGNGG